MAINWGLAGGNNALAHFDYGMSLGTNLRERQAERETRNALAAYAQDPGEETINGVIATDPRLGVQLRGQMQEQQRSQQEQRRADLPMVGRLLDYAQDEQTYQQALGVAQQYGIDTSTLPQSYGDGSWVDQQRTIFKALNSPQGQEVLSSAGKQAVDMGFQPGTPEFNQAVTQLVEAGLAQPYMGSQGETRLYTPRIGQQAQQGPQPGAIEDGYRFKGGNPADPNSWERVADQVAPTLGAAYRTQTVTAEEANRIRQSLGPNGQAAFEQWMRDNNIVIGGM